MLYDKYVNKAKKIVSFKNFIIRFRAIIIAISASTLTLSTSYVSTKGIILDKTECPLTIQYGESIDYEANALFADVSYEYSLADQEAWTTTMPTRPGKYKVRGVSKRIFGGVSYGKEHVFEIQPKLVDVKISDEELIYGEKAQVEADLINGDVISDISFEYSKLDTQTPTIKAIEESIVVKDSQGNDISHYYTFNAIEKEISLLKRAITITVHGDEKLYDGTSLICHQYELTENTLFSNDQIYATFNASQLEVGNTKNEAEVKIINKQGIDTTKYYSINFEVGDLEVTARPLLVYTPSSSKIYDGLGLSNTEYTIDETTSLIDGHQVIISASSTITNVGNIENVVAIDICDSNDEKVTDNYAISYVVGTLEVTPKTIKITSGSSDKTYDGMQLNCLDYTIDDETPLVENHTIEVSNASSITNVGTTDNILEFTILNGEEDVTSNYDVELTCGTLKVDKKDITILSASDSKEYDGTALESKLYDIIDGSLVDGQSIHADFTNSITNVGEISNSFTVTIKDKENNDLSSNYNIKLEEGLLTVTKREIDILTLSDEKEYDGTKLTQLNFKVISTKQLVDNQVAEVVTNSSIIDVGEIDNELSFKVKQGNEDVTNNYKINVTFGTLKVTKRSITITSSSKERQYNAEEFYCHEYEVTAGSLAENQRIENTYNNSIINVGTIKNSFETIIKDENNIDVTANYNITKVDGILTVSKRIVDIQVASDEKVYDGTPLTCLDYEITSENKIAGTDVLNIISNTSTTNVGIVDNVLEFSVRTADNKDNNDNYQINVTNGKLKITYRKISITTNSDSKTYDDTALFNKGYTITDGYIADNQRIELVDYPSVTDVSEEVVYNTLKFKLYEGNVDVTDNYTLDITYGTLIINPIVLKYETGSVTKTYDGLEISNDEINFVSGSILSHHKITAKTYKVVKDAGVYDNDVEYEVIDKNTNEIKSHNYKIEVNAGKIIINPIELSITTPSLSKEYDGIAISANTYVMTGTLAPNQTISIEINNSLKEVGTLPNNFTLTIKDAQGNETTHNYEITSNIGTLQITPRPLTIATGSASKTYDGEPLTKDEYEITSGTLAPNQTLTVIVTGTITDVGITENTFNITIKDEQGNNTDQNYYITEQLGTLTVNPITLTIQTASGSKVYDGLPLVKDTYEIIEGSMPSNHTLNITFVNTPTDVCTLTNDFIPTITNDKGEDITENYEITSILGTLVITPRPLTIETESARKVYDGTPLTKDGYEITSGTLAPNQTITAMVIGTITNVGTVSNEIDVLVTDVMGVDTTHNYEITRVLGTLEITLRPLTIETGSASKVYDGTPLTKDGYEITSGTLAPNQNATITIIGTITDVGIVDNEIDIIIEDESGNITTDNYEITRILGTLEITKRELTIKTGSAEKVYDGTALTKDGYEITTGTLAANQEATITVVGTITNVGRESNYVDIIIIDSNQNDVTANYEIIEDFGMLEVTYRPLTIQTGSAEKVYDGTPLTKDGYEITSGTLAPNQTITATVIGTITNAGEVKNYIDIIISDAAGNDTTSNYAIDFDLGTLMITPRKITIKTNGATKVYDGTPLTKDGYEIISGTFVENQSYVITVIGTITDAGTVDNIVDLQVKDIDGNDVSANYEVIGEYGELVVTPRPLTIKTNDATKVYDGTPLTKDGYEIIAGTLAPNQTCVITVVGSITNAGETKNVVDIIISDVDGNDTTHNYKIIDNYGILKVTHRPLTIKTGSAEKVYDGTPLTKDGYEITSGTLAPNQTYVITVTGTITEVGSTLNGFDIIISDAEGNDTTENYDISNEEVGILTINPVELFYSTGSAEKVYDGTELTNSELTYISGQLLPNHEIIIYTIGTITDAGSIINEVYYEIYDINTKEDQTSHYKINIDYGTLTVKPIVLTYKTGSGEKVYDGTPLTNSKIVSISGTPLQGHTVSIEAIGTITNVGIVDNVVNYMVVNENNVDVTYNYEFIIDCGTLEVKPIVLKYKTGGASKEYDGTPLTNSEVTLISGKVLKGHTITIAAVGTITNVGTCMNDIEYSIVDANNNDVTSNYDIDCEYGILRIKGVEIVVKTGSATKVYDGSPLTNDKITYNYESLKNGHTLYFEITGSQTEIGQSYNEVTVIIYDSEGNDITDVCYDVNYQKGILTVTDESESNAGGDYGGNMGSGNGSVNLDTSGNLSGVGFGEGEGEAPTVFYITSTTSGAIYFRLNSFGDYNYSSWDNIPPGFNSLEALTNPNYLTARALQANGLQEQSVTIEYAVDSVTYLLPYYATNAPENVSNDYFINPQHDTTYTLNYIPYNYSSADAYNLIGTQYEELEKDYYEFVKQTYLTLPDSTKTSMLQIAADNSIDVNSPTLIEDVANYIQNAATYNMNFQPFPFGVDYAVYFLTESKEGICQHYATAATAMYRALGIPARYTTGFVGYATANEKSKVTTKTYHAWVEVYIEGMGWVEVEVTGAGAAGGGEGPGEGESGSEGSNNNSGNPSNLDTSGKLSGAGQTGGEFMDPVTMFNITSQTDGTVYLKIMSFGDYTLDGWDATPTIYESLNSKTNPMYLSSKALENGKYNSYEILIEYEENELSYLLPYYTIDGPENMPTDYIINPNRSESYTLNYIPYTYSSSDDISLKGTEYETLEAEYYEFVKDNYLSLPASTYLKMLEIAGDNNLDASSPTIIEDVAEYIQNAATYNLKFEPFPEGVDYAVYFLTEAKEGICQHYSTAAVAMYRALGIPARYTVGFVGEAVANTKSPVTNETAHAWVEVYIQGMGWVNVEVTGSGPGGGGFGEQEDDPIKKIKSFTVKPIDLNKEYDGTPLYAENEVDFESDKNLTTLFSHGYTWDVEVSGYQTDYGSSYSEVTSFTIYDPKGNDVTSNYKITYKRGELLVTGPQIEFYVMSYHKDYDGKELAYTKDDCIVLAPEGISVEYDIEGAITKPGKVEAVITNVVAKNELGEDVTDDYYIDIIAGNITIEKINLEITAGSSEKVYDGTPLTNPNYWISFGKLLEGHELIVEVSGKITDVGEEENKIIDIVILDENGNDVTDYYEIKAVKGLLKII